MFRTNVRVPRPRAADVGRVGAALGSCEGAAAGSCGAAANFDRPGAADGSCEGAAPTRRKGAATLFRAGPPENLTFKIKFGAANICSKFEKFCQIFSAHSTSCDFVFVCVPTNRNLKKFQNSFIIYIESEGKRKENSQLRTSIFLHFHAGVRNK